MKFSVEIEMDNAAFDDESNGRRELARLLAALSGRVMMGDDAGTLSDYNGNKVGAWDVTTTHAEDDRESRKIAGYVIVDDEDTVMSDPVDITDAKREAEDWNETSAEDFATEADQTAEEYKAAGRIGGFWPIYFVKAVDADGDTHDIADVIQLGDTLEVHTGN